MTTLLHLAAKQVKLWLVFNLLFLILHLIVYTVTRKVLHRVSIMIIYHFLIFYVQNILNYDCLSVSVFIPIYTIINEVHIFHYFLLTFSNLHGVLGFWGFGVATF